jgi:hypothetical protein
MIPPGFPPAIPVVFWPLSAQATAVVFLRAIALVSPQVIALVSP